jgi:hypothetical protein
MFLAVVFSALLATAYQEQAVGSRDLDRLFSLLKTHEQSDQDPAKPIKSRDCSMVSGLGYKLGLEWLFKDFP